MMNSKTVTRKAALTLATIGFFPLAALTNLAGPAAGADFWQPSSDLLPAADKVDFASNWYVRGDIAYAQETFPKIAPNFPNLGFDGSPSVLNNYSVGAGMGYKVNDWFRTDLILDYRSQVRTVGNGNPTFCEIVLPSVTTGLPTPSPQICSGRFDTSIRRWDLLANGYIDIGTWQGFTPYIGAGAGVTWARINQSVNWSLINGVRCGANCGFVTPTGTVIFADFDRTQGSIQYHFAWALMAGVAMAVTDHVQLDVGYRFLDLGHIAGISTFTGAPITKKVIANEVRGGLRYMSD